MKTTADSARVNGSSLYAKYCRPKLSDLIESVKLDSVYTRARGPYLYRQDPVSGEEEQVLDLVGGFGAGLFGHNNPEIKDFLKARLDEDIPFLAQSSQREEAGRLAKHINELLPGEESYICHLANSGAEAVEAILKHAYKVRFDDLRRTFERVARMIEEFFQQTDRDYPDIEVPGSERDLGKFRDDLDEHNLAQFESFQNNPVVLALKGSFHGKTSSALKMTFNKTYREGFEGLSGIRPNFIDPTDIERLEDIVKEHQVEFLIPKVEDRRIVIETMSYSTIIALCIEVIQGEGGIHPLSDTVLRQLADRRSSLNVPLFIDEIQTGCGRTGAFTAYSEGPLRDCAPEYITMGKSLGGGLVKIGAALIREDIYDHDFGILHTSTFAEDELGCAVADRVLDILVRDDGAFMKSVTEKGDYLLSGLRKLQQDFPSVIREVRGRGLMIGLEFSDLTDKSSFFRFGARQGFLSLVIASYLLHHHGIRMLAPLTSLLKGNPGKKRACVLRIQPAESISRGDIDDALAALREVCTVIFSNNEGVLIGHLVGLDISDAERANPPVLDDAEETSEVERIDFDARIGMIMHPTQVDQILHLYFPSLVDRVEKSALAAWWNRLSRFLEPDLVHRDYIGSEGFVIEANFVLVPFLPQYMSETYIRGRRSDGVTRIDRARFLEVQDKVQDAVTTAKELGDDHIPTSIVGLGAYTSIVTDRGRVINDYEIPVTTGNAYTTGLMIEGILRAADLRQISLPKARAAVVGAAGNIGSALAAILCTHVGSLRLIGRSGGDSMSRLRKTRLKCLLYLCQKAREQIHASVPIKNVQVGGVGDRILHEIVLPGLASVDKDSGWARAEAWLREGEGVSPELGSLLEEALDREGGEEGNAYITLHDSIEAVGECDIVTIATSSPESRLVTPEPVKKGAVVSCASVPSNLSAAFKDHLEDYLVFDGGHARLPEGQEIRFVGLPSGGLAHGCFSETLLLGFDGQNNSFARGSLTPEQVEQTLEMAGLYGFELGELIMVDLDDTMKDGGR